MAGGASALEFQPLPGRNDADGQQAFSIQMPAPVYDIDQCDSMLNHMRDTGALSGPESNTPDNRGPAVVVGLRFAFGGPPHQVRHATVDIWQPAAAANARGQAMAEYEGCRKNQAIQGFRASQ